jgi:DNA-binding response OmpR family regulator
MQALPAKGGNMPHKILIVDDEPDVIRIIELNLKQAGYDVITAQDGETALQQAAAEQPDLILMDQIMTGMSGSEAVRRLKANDATADVPVVILTAQNTTEDMMESWESGTDLYLTKPIMPAELIDIIKTILR